LRGFLQWLHSRDCEFKQVTIHALGIDERIIDECRMIENEFGFNDSWIGYLQNGERVGECRGSPSIDALSARFGVGYWSDSLAPVGSCKERSGKGRGAYRGVRGGCPSPLPRQSICRRCPPWRTVLLLWIWRLSIYEFEFRRRFRIPVSVLDAVRLGFIRIPLQICVGNVDKDGLGILLRGCVICDRDLRRFRITILRTNQ